MPIDRLDRAKLNNMAQQADSPTQAILETIKTAVEDQVNDYSEWAHDDHGIDEQEQQAAAAYVLAMIAGSAMAASVMMLCEVGIEPGQAKAFTVQQVTRLAQSSMEQAITERMLEAGIASDKVQEVLAAARAVHARKEDPEGSDDDGNG